jgi:hypothetical protein
MNGRALLVALVVTTACGGRSSEHHSDGSGDDAGAENGGSSGSGSNTGGASGSGSNTGGSSATSGSSGSAGDELNRIFLYDENNYQTTSQLTIPTVETASGVDIDICWTDVMSDLDCDPVDPQNEIDAVAMLRFRGLSEAEIMSTLASGEINQNNFDAYIQWESDHQSTCTKLSSLTVFGSPVDVTEEYQESDDNVYAFLFNRGVTPGTGSVTMVFGRPNGASMNTTLDAPDGCGLRDSSSSLSEPVLVPPDGPWVVDWSNLTRDGQGNDFAYSRINGLTLWFVAGATSSEVEEHLTDLDDIATESFRLELGGGRSADLSGAQNASGESFLGFGRPEEGIWLLALTCNECQSPASLFLGVLEPVAERP